MMEEAMRAAALALMLLFVVSAGSASSDCGPSTTEASGDARVLSAVVDAQRAERSQRQHLEALFNRYGENGTISLAGLKRLLQNVGLDRIRTVMVKHHEQPGHHDHHDHEDHPHHHHHHHHHDNNSHHHKHDHGDSSQSKTFSKKTENQDVPGKKSEDSGGHLKLYDKRTAPVAQEGGTTAPYSAKLLVKPQDRPSPAGEQTTGTTTESHIQETAVDQDHLQNHSLDGAECLNASSILSSHGMSQEAGVTLGDFSFLCPALLNQIDGGACILHGDASEHEEREHKHHRHAHGHHGDHNRSDHSERSGGENSRNITIAWVGGFLSITIISLLSLLGVVLIPLMNRVFFKFLLSFLVALAVGTLSGDAFLHLIPHAQGGHHHHHEDALVEEHHVLHDEREEDLDAVWKGLTALSGVYFMFLIEHFLTLGKMYKDKKQKIQKKWEQNDKADPEKQPALGENDLKPSEDVETNGAGTFGDHSSSLHSGGGTAEEEQVMLAPQVSVVSPQAYGRASDTTAYTAEDCENKCHSHFHDTVGQADSMHHHHHDYHHILHHHHSQNHHPHSHSHSYSEQHFQQAGVATLAWMVIMGDGLHNFSDGLAIGAAFTEGLSSGLSTSVAVFCHELPHELGDFAVLLKAGMTVRQAILYNVLSAMMAYLGMVTGILIGHYAENISMWIFALTAGLFMYVALVDMVPEMLHNDAGDHGFSHWGFFLLQNAGILLGFCIMLLIAVFEHKIQLDLGY
ncbi:zinc transporter ZIP6 isoform X2 [Parambassis ranga]|nr:zinc transporter ZIP6 isoform X2 [Parambassis ranga]XP_028283176.1 zinc transporter ZIP6 isoform X2 [Parambassis ranga]XP_028283177.1 zinc transporter ZIP6 isoform X2 [Parambassis ranga]XP_028283178.1 zinc transporter ZIP6 isoform X2 [Parambassis ranga]XP_028283179.1 zinc transporter ZIP6 isoform X2 [Parambassis ranga]XP_028283180.1 zinc transporter ZIP6 isoform X2 [Parambassis ranga]XP_028283181.1 zinc transporter ZIP6 isoform X2 [Parambassis ranga]